MTGGRFIAVVGPSGVGKDSLIDALCAARHDLHRVRRVITREAGAAGEAHDAVTPALFAARAAGGDFALHWEAHGLSYGIPSDVDRVLGGGGDVIANLSRGRLAAAARRFDTLIVLSVVAAPEVLAKRLAHRGRESRAEITRRLARPAPVFPDGLKVIEIDNSRSLDSAVQSALGALYPERV